MGLSSEPTRDPVVDCLILDLLEWILKEKTYEEVMDAWRTSCPRLPVWEDANDLGLVATEFADGRVLVKPTAAGLAWLMERRPHRTAGSVRLQSDSNCEAAPAH